MYHSIESVPKETVMRSLHVSPKKFRFQMWLLKTLGYKALSLKKLKPYLKQKKYQVNILLPGGKKKFMYLDDPEVATQAAKMFGAKILKVIKL